MAPLAIMGLGIQELGLILLIVLLLFGAKKIPDIARGLGEGIRGFRTSLKGDEPSADDRSADDRSVADRSVADRSVADKEAPHKS